MRFKAKCSGRSSTKKEHKDAGQEDAGQEDAGQEDAEQEDAEQSAK